MICSIGRLQISCCLLFSSSDFYDLLLDSTTAMIFDKLSLRSLQVLRDLYVENCSGSLKSNAQNDNSSISLKNDNFSPLNSSCCFLLVLFF